MCKVCLTRPGTDCDILLVSLPCFSVNHYGRSTNSISMMDGTHPMKHYDRRYIYLDIRDVLQLVRNKNIASSLSPFIRRDSGNFWRCHPMTPSRCRSVKTDRLERDKNTWYGSITSSWFSVNWSVVLTPLGSGLASNLRLGGVAWPSHSMEHYE